MIPIYPVLLLAVHKSVVIEINSQDLIIKGNKILTPILYVSVIKFLIVLSQGITNAGSSLKRNFLNPSLFTILNG